MPTILTHTAVPLALGLGLGKEIVPRRVLWAGVALSILPDLDVLAFRFGIPYAAPFGHRGATSTQERSMTSVDSKRDSARRRA